MSDAPLAPLVLVVDDDEVFRRQLVRGLRTRGFRAEAAAEGVEALARAEELAPDAAIVDLRMPAMGGLDVVRGLREADPELRIVVLTGYGSIATAVDALKLGAADYLQKPAGLDEIVAALQGGQPAAPASDPVSAPSLARAEWEYIQRVLAECDGNISEAARRLGLHRRSLQRKLQKYPPRA
jgi:two-component system response regulator RegA